MQQEERKPQLDGEVDRSTCYKDQPAIACHQNYNEQNGRKRAFGFKPFNTRCAQECGDMHCVALLHKRPVKTPARAGPHFASSFHGLPEDVLVKFGRKIPNEEVRPPQGCAGSLEEGTTVAPSKQKQGMNQVTIHAASGLREFRKSETLASALASGLVTGSSVGRLSASSRGSPPNAVAPLHTGAA